MSTFADPVPAGSVKGLCATRLAVVRGGRRLLSGLEIGVRTGERLAVVGPSGCGKSSLLRALAGLDDPADGEVTLDGATPGQGGWPEFRRQVVYVAQRPRLGPGDVQAVLRRPFQYRTAERPFDETRARALLETLGVGDLWGHVAARLSEGQAQRVGLARALLVAPRFLLLDEPTSALDPDSVAAVERSVEASGAGALIVTHDPAQAARWCHRTLDLREHVDA